MLFELLMSPSTTAIIAPPTGFSAVTFSSSQINLSWTNASGGLQTEVWRNGVLRTTASAGVTSFADNAISDGIEYSYWLRHKSGSNFSVPTATITRSGSPPAPGPVVVSVVTDDVTVQWSNTATTQTAVRVYRDAVLIATVGAGDLSYADNNRPNGTYVYTVRNYNGVAESVDSTSDTAVVSYNPPLTDPSGFTATATHSDRVALAWTNGDATAQTEIYRGTSPSPTTLIHTASAGTTSYNDDNRLQGTTYYYRIRHVKGGSLSNYVSDDAPTLVTAFLSVQLTADESTENVVLTWSLENPPVSPVASHGDWSDTEGEEVVNGPVSPITSPRNVVAYGNIVPIHTGTDLTGTLSYLRVHSGGGELLAEQTNLTVDFSTSPEA